MKTVFLVSFDDEVDSIHETEWSMKALNKARSNQLAIDSIYDECIRSVIKYSNDPVKSKIAEEIWKNIGAHFDE